MIELTLPWPPSVNHYKKIGALVRTHKGKIYQARVNTTSTTTFYFLVRQIIAKEGVKSFNRATIALEVDAYPPDRRKRDLDGILKVLLDSLQRGGLFEDDYQVARLVVTRKDTIPQGKVVVRVSQLESTK